MGERKVIFGGENGKIADEGRREKEEMQTEVGGSVEKCRRKEREVHAEAV